MSELQKESNVVKVSDPNSLGFRERFSTYDDWLQAKKAEERRWRLAKLAVEIQKSGGMEKAIAEIADSLSLAHDELVEAKVNYDSKMVAFGEIADIFELGGEIVVAAAPEKQLEVWGWSGSEYYERHEVAKTLTGGEQFVGRSISWDDSDAVLKIYNSAIAGDTRSNWVILHPMIEEPDYEIVAVNLPEIQFSDELKA